MRCFVAVELDAAARRVLGAWLRRQPRPRGLAWCRPEQLHITLKFLGEIAETQVAGIAAALAEAARRAAPFSLRLAALGAFPSHGRPRVLCCGVADAGGACAALAARVDAAFEALGFAPEARPFAAHVTLARARGPDGEAALRDLLAAESRAESNPFAGAEPFAVPRVVLFESRLAPGGAQYVAAATATLRSAE